MKTEWDYTSLADAYLKRPEYSGEGLETLFRAIQSNESWRICDIGAGVAHLTIPLALKGFSVDAVEPNDAMRANGVKRTTNLSKVYWFEGTGENTGMPSSNYDCVTFGSSFNVVDRGAALAEVKRILKPGGWFVCMWNHRDFNDMWQEKIENVIAQNVAGYDVGLRRQDQMDFLKSSSYFHSLGFLEAPVVHFQSHIDCVEAWRSHATLQRQAGERFSIVVEQIAETLKNAPDPLPVPFHTRIWFGKLKQ